MLRRVAAWSRPSIALLSEPPGRISALPDAAPREAQSDLDPGAWASGRTPTAGAWLLVLTLTMLFWAGGCEALSFMSVMAGGGDTVPAVYKLADRPTLVLVDDPGGRLGGPGAGGVVAANAAYHLRGRLKSRVVPEKRLNDLAARLGEQYESTPVDRIGRLLGADQVVYVGVERVTFQPNPGVYRPKARVQVQVIDVPRGRRLFPPPPPIREPGARSRGRTLEVELKARGVGVPSRGRRSVVVRQLAQRLGRKIAQLFYKHKKEKPFGNSE